MQPPYNGKDSALTKHHMLSTTHSTRNRQYPIESLAKGVQKTFPPNIVGCCQMPLVICHNLMICSMAGDTTYLCHRNWRNLTVAKQETLALLTRFHSTTRRYTQ